MYSFVGSYSRNDYSSIHEFDIWKDLRTDNLYIRSVPIRHYELLGYYRGEPRAFPNETKEEVPDLQLFKGDLKEEYSKSTLNYR